MKALPFHLVPTFYRRKLALCAVWVKLHILISVNKERQFLLCFMVAQEKHFINLLLAEIRQKRIIYIYIYIYIYISPGTAAAVLEMCSCCIYSSLRCNWCTEQPNCSIGRVVPSKYFTVVQVHCLVVSMLCHLRQHVKLWAAHCKIYEEIKYGKSHCCTWRFLTKSSCHSKKT